MGISMINLRAADVNADGSVNFIDAGILMRHTAGWGDYLILPHRPIQGFTFPAFAMARMPLSITSTAAISITDASGKPGDRIQVPISLVNNPGMTAMRIDVSFDTNALRLIGFPTDMDTGLLRNPIHPPYKGGSTVIFAWTDFLATVNNVSNGNIVVLEFEILDTALPGEYGITVSYEPNNILNAALSPVSVSTGNGTITVSQKQQTKEQTPGGQAPDGQTDIIQANNETAVNDTVVPLAGLSGFAPFIQGYPDKTFRGDNTMSRQEFVTILYRLLNPVETPIADPSNPSFNDVRPGHWAYDAIEWAKETGIIEPGEDGSFRPAEPITRVEMAVMLVKANEWTETAENTFGDIYEHPDLDYILKAVHAGVFEGYPDGTFKPDDNITRYEVVAALIRYLLGGEPSADMLEGTEVTLTDVPLDHWAYLHFALATTGFAALPELVLTGR